MEYAFTIAGGGRILPEHLPNLVRRLSQGGGRPGTMRAEEDDTPHTLEEIEIAHLLRTLERHNGNKTTASAELGISLKTMYNKLNRLNERRAAG